MAKQSKAPPLDEGKARRFLELTAAGGSFYPSLRAAGLDERTLWSWLRRGAAPTRFKGGKLTVATDDALRPYAEFRAEYARLVIGRVQGVRPLAGSGRTRPARRTLSDADEA